MSTTTAEHPPRVLSIAGSDPSGGAGVQADIKSISAHGGYAMAVLTALTAQNTRGVRAVHVPPADFLAEQLKALSDDVVVDAVKIGMLADAAVVEVVSDWLGRHRPPVVVLDPVMVASSGDRLLRGDAELAVTRLISGVDLITPNLLELAVLVGESPAVDWPGALDQARRLSTSHRVRVLAKGGHLSGAAAPDALVEGDIVVDFPGTRIATAHTHGTGCSLSSAVATLQARTGDWATSVHLAKQWLAGAIAHADQLDVGTGTGPVHHFHALWTAAGDERRPNAG